VELELEAQEVYVHHEKVRDLTFRALRVFDLEYRIRFPFWSRGIDLYEDGRDPLPPLTYVSLVSSLYARVCTGVCVCVYVTRPLGGVIQLSL
jgi:hypothetical protein